MKVSLDWLNAYLDRPIDAAQAESVLTDLGFPIDGREDVAGGDVMLDVEVTSNRSDCLSHVGVARELAAGTGQGLRMPATELPSAGDEPAGRVASVTNDARDLCPLYTARVIRSVKVGPSPDWLRRRLEAVGLRSVNNVVDVTNYVLLELGQPLHAFDLARLEGAAIVVRRAAADEPFVAIDGSKHALHHDMLVIADRRRPVAVAGVMGGLDSEVGDATTDVLLESAIFEPLSVRRTSRALKLASDSSFRFERGVDPLGVERASRRAAQLIVELAGGTLCEGVIRVGQDDPTPRSLTMRLARCHAILGREVAPQRMVELLDRLGLSPQLDEAAGRITCTAPSHRLDLGREIDLIEEVARTDGYDRIAVRDHIELIVRPKQTLVTARQRLSDVLVAHGYHETVTFSFIAPRCGEPFVPAGHEAVRIEDERRKGESMLRPSLLPSLLLCRKTNQDAGNRGVRLFEVATAWAKVDGRIAEHQTAALLADADGADLARTMRDLRGTIEELMQRLAGQATLRIEPTELPFLTAAGRVLLDGRDIGLLGAATPAVQQLFDLQTPVVLAELAWPQIAEGFPPQTTVSELPRFPAIERDLSIVVAESVTWESIAAEVAACQPALLEELRFLDVYRGKPIAKGAKSVSFRMLFRDAAGTLRHEQVDPQVASVVARLQANLQAQLRA